MDAKAPFLRELRDQVTPEHEKHGANDAKACPQEVQPRWLPHVEHRERHKYYERYRFLKNLQLGKGQLCRADPIRRNHEHVLEQCNAPAQEGRDIPFSVAEISQVSVSCERHEDVGDDEQRRGSQKDHVGIEKESCGSPS